MAEETPLSKALAGIGVTIQSITGKVEAGKERVRVYKKQIISKLGEVIVQLNSLKTNNSTLTVLPELKKQLEESQTSLRQKTTELEETKGRLINSSKELEDLKKNLDALNKTLQEKTDQLKALTDANSQKDGKLQDLDKKITELTKQISELTKQKEDSERMLGQAQQESNSLIEKIGQINTTLSNQINLIDSIANELGDLGNSGDEVALQFKAVGDNIASIMSMLSAPSGPSSGPPVVQPIQQVINQDTENLYQKILTTEQQRLANFYRNIDGTSTRIIQQNINRAKAGDSNAVQAIKGELEKVIRSGNIPLLGGKGRRRRTKKRTKHANKSTKRRTKQNKKKLKGGYTYKTSKNLDKNSVVISSSSNKRSKKVLKSS